MYDVSTEDRVRLLAAVLIGVMALGLAGLVVLSLWKGDDAASEAFPPVEAPPTILSPEPSAGVPFSPNEFPEEAFPTDPTTPVLPPPAADVEKLPVLADSGPPQPPSYEAVASFGAMDRFRKVGRSVGMLEVRFEDADGKPSAMICTAALIAPDLLLTNQHCISRSDYRATHARVRLGFLGEEWIHDVFPVNTMPVEMDEALDYAVLRTAGRPGDQYGTIALHTREARTDEPFFVIHHPAGRVQQLSREDCYEETTRTTKRDDLLLHRCDVEPGSSGSLLLALADDAVVGLNRAGLPGRYGGATPSTVLLDHSRLLRQVARGSYQPPRAAQPPAPVASRQGQQRVIFEDTFEHAPFIIENPDARRFVPRTRPVSLRPDEAFEITAVVKKGGTSSANYGLVWGAAPQAGSFYVFSVSDQGRFSVSQVVQGRWGTPMVRGVSSYVATGDRAVNELTVRREGDVLYFLINGEHVARMPYAGFAGTGVGFGAGPGIRLEAQGLKVTVTEQG